MGHMGAPKDKTAVGSVWTHPPGTQVGQMWVCPAHTAPQFTCFS